MRAPVVSNKHYVQQTLTTVTAGTINNFVIADALAIKDIAAVNDVQQGCVIKAVFVEMWARGQDTSPGSVLITLVKTVDFQTPTFADMTALDTYKNKKNVFYHTQGLTNINAQGAIPFVRQWFKLPKGKQRFGLGDRLFLCTSAQALDTNICGFATYKEYT